MKKVFFAALAATALLTACNKPGATKVNLKNDVDTLSYAIGLQQNLNDEQIKQMLVQMGSDSAYVEQFFKGFKAGLEAGDDKKQLAFMLGQQAGLGTKFQTFANIEHQVFAGDSTQHLSIKQFLLGLSDARHGNSAFVDETGKPMDAQALNEMLRGVAERMTKAASEKMYGPKKKASEEFMAKIAKQADVKKLDNGVYYKVIKEGDGSIPTADQEVTVEYEGRLMDGTVFDSTKNHGDQPAKFICSQVIPGWTNALTHMHVGSEWEVYIPYDQAYGERESGPIPAYSALVFKIKLLDARKPEAPAQPQLQIAQ